MKQAGKPKRKGEKEGEQSAPPGMGGDSANNVSKIYMERLESLTAESVAQYSHRTNSFTVVLKARCVVEHLLQLIYHSLCLVRAMLFWRDALCSPLLDSYWSRHPPHNQLISSHACLPTYCSREGQQTIPLTSLAAAWLTRMRVDCAVAPLYSSEGARKIDLSYNKLSNGVVDALSAFVCAIPGSDLIRAEPLLLDMRGNQLSPAAIERMGLQIRKTPRSEVKLVSFEEGNSIISLYGTNKCVVRIDCRGCNGMPAKASLRDKLNLGSNVSEKLLHAFPGDIPAQGTIYPRDEVMKYKPLE